MKDTPPPPAPAQPLPAAPEAQTPHSAAPVAEPAPATPPPAEKRPLLKRLFGISFWGGVKLLGLCILVGFFVMAANFDPQQPSFHPLEALRSILRQTFAALGWALQNFWQPALAGAVVVLPIWVLWRLVSLPFRK